MLIIASQCDNTLFSFLIFMSQIGPFFYIVHQYSHFTWKYSWNFLFSNIMNFLKRKVTKTKINLYDHWSEVFNVKHLVVDCFAEYVRSCLANVKAAIICQLLNQKRHSIRSIHLYRSVCRVIGRILGLWYTFFNNHFVYRCQRELSLVSYKLFRV